MRRTITYSADRSRTLDLNDLAKIVEEAEKLGVTKSTSPTVTIAKSTPTANAGEIRKVSFTNSVRPW